MVLRRLQGEDEAITTRKPAMTLTVTGTISWVIRHPSTPVPLHTRNEWRTDGVPPPLGSATLVSPSLGREIRFFGSKRLEVSRKGGPRACCQIRARAINLTSSLDSPTFLFQFFACGSPYDRMILPRLHASFSTIDLASLIRDCHWILSLSLHLVRFKSFCRHFLYKTSFGVDMGSVRLALAFWKAIPGGSCSFRWSECCK